MTEQQTLAEILAVVRQEARAAQQFRQMVVLAVVIGAAIRWLAGGG